LRRTLPMSVERRAVRPLLVAIWAPPRPIEAPPPVRSDSVVRVFRVELHRIAPAVRRARAWLSDADSPVTTPSTMPPSVVPADLLAPRSRVTVLGVVRAFGVGHKATLPASKCRLRFVAVIVPD
jgi:hypothetical protein